MVNVLSFNPKGYNVWFYSDFHVGHSQPFIMNPRGFKDADEAKETLITNWNSKVTNNDICFLLGDTVVGAGLNSEKVFEELLNRLNYKELYLAPGNHTSGYRQRFKKEFLAGNSIDDFYRLSFNVSPGKRVHLIPNYYEIYINKQFVVLSHYPVYSWNDIGRGAFMLHGHCHGRINGKLEGKILDLGPESIGNYPLSFVEIKEIMDSKELKSPDYH